MNIEPHKNAKMIKALADNKRLVVFYRVDGTWYETEFGTLVTCENPHFLCLPQHKEACLHWLNGGDVQHDDCSHGWATMENINDPMDADEPLWSKTCRLMTEHLQFRIKPKKEKRTIVIYENIVCFVNPDAIYPKGCQFIEIEVEV